MTKSTLKEKFARLGPIQAVDLVRSGSSEVVALRPAIDLRRVKTIDAILALRRRGLSMMKAKRAVEIALRDRLFAVEIPMVESVDAMAIELNEAGFACESCNEQ